MSEQIIRHPNGGAAKIGLEVHVSADSFCDAESVMAGMSHIFSSVVSNSRLRDCQSFNSSLQRSVAIGSVLAESSCERLLAQDTVLHKVAVESNGYGLISLKDVVAENCELYGNWALEGNFRIHEGVWHRAPRGQRITGDNGVDVGITECKPGYAMMACWCKPITQWLKSGPRLGVKHGWSQEQINLARLFYEMLGDVPMEM